MGRQMNCSMKVQKLLFGERERATGYVLNEKQKLFWDFKYTVTAQKKFQKDKL